MHYTDRAITPTGLNIIQIGFFAAPASCFCKSKFSHVELRFSDYTVTSITRGGNGRVHMIKDKKMSNPNYRGFFEIAISVETERMMRYFADHCEEEFSVLSMYWNFIPFLQNWPIRNRGTFCSAYVCKILQTGGFCQEMDPYRVSPDLLFAELAGDERTVCSFNRCNIFSEAKKILHTDLY